MNAAALHFPITGPTLLFPFDSLSLSLFLFPPFFSLSLSHLDAWHEECFIIVELADFCNFTLEGCLIFMASRE